MSVIEVIVLGLLGVAFFLIGPSVQGAIARLLWRKNHK